MKKKMTRDQNLAVAWKAVKFALAPKNSYRPPLQCLHVHNGVYTATNGRVLVQYKTPNSVEDTPPRLISRENVARIIRGEPPIPDTIENSNFPKFDTLLPPIGSDLVTAPRKLLLDTVQIIQKELNDHDAFIAVGFFNSHIHVVGDGASLLQRSFPCGYPMPVQFRLNSRFLTNVLKAGKGDIVTIQFNSDSLDHIFVNFPKMPEFTSIITSVRSELTALVGKPGAS